MFQSDRWALAFINALDASGSSCEEGLAVLQALVPGIKNIHRRLSGTTAASQLEKMIRQSAAQAGITATAMETAIRFIALLVRKNLFGRIDLVIKNIEKIIDERNGVLELTLESAQPLDVEFQNTLKTKLIQETGAKEIRIIPRLLPELLGGCRLLIGSEAIDASLRGRIRKMAADLDAKNVPLTAGGNAW
ncbi:MAG: F0F1 ATP synthase subunit delta [Treponema sp.]|jgi:F0F1-type ATP synthase delta subunit|nr:F0F1 ATP synthase subunit delta [Treponema sp.]